MEDKTELWFIPRLPIYCNLRPYDPNELKKTIEIFCTNISKKLGLDVGFYNIRKENEVLKTNYYDDIILVCFSDSNKYLDLKFEIPILAMTTNGSFVIKGYEYFLVKGIRETIWDQKQSYRTKLRILNYEIDPFLTENLQFGVKAKVGDLKTMLRYYLKKNPEYFEESEILTELAKSTRLKPLSNSEVDMFERREIMMFLTIYETLVETSELISQYALNTPDLLAKTGIITVSKELIDNIENEQGFSLVHKKVVTETDLLSSSVIKDILMQITSTVRTLSKRKKLSTIAKRTFVDPSKIVFNYLHYEDFVSPYAFLANQFKLTIVGDEMCFRTEVKDSYRDVHVTHLFNLDPVTTTDKEKVGVDLWLSADVTLDKFNRFANLLDIEYERLSRIFDNYFDKLAEKLHTATATTTVVQLSETEEEAPEETIIEEEYDDE